MSLVEILFELGKISPYLVLPAIFFYIMVKVNKDHTSFLREIIKERSEQMNNVTQALTSLTETVTNEMHSQHEKIENKVDKTNEKIDNFRIELATNPTRKQE